MLRLDSAPQRRQIEQQGYTIIANIGDQPSDLDGGFSEQTYLLPNPFYRVP
jgi:acid phosphatase